MTHDGCEGCIFLELDTTGYLCSICDTELVSMDACPLDEEGSL